jgi:hypothetical protein
MQYRVDFVVLNAGHDQGQHSYHSVRSDYPIEIPAVKDRIHLGEDLVVDVEQRFLNYQPANDKNEQEDDISGASLICRNVAG